MSMWPNFFIVGVPKAGTTTLHHHLGKIPGIYMSKIKEPNFFSVRTIPKKKPFDPVRDTNSYLELFSQITDEKIVGESSTNYLYDPEAANLIHQKVPNAFILMSLRDPVERAWSHYLMLKSPGLISDSFHEQIKKELNNQVDLDKPHIRLKAGIYFDDVKKYLDLFGENKVKILIFEEWIKNIRNTLNEIIKFLNLSYEIKDDLQEVVRNPYTVPRGKIAQKIIGSSRINKISHMLLSESTKNSVKGVLSKKTPKPKMDNESREILIKYYQNDVKKLEELLQRKLPWTNF